MAAMFVLYGDLSAENRMSRLMRKIRPGPNSGSRDARSAAIGPRTHRSYVSRCASKYALELSSWMPMKKRWASSGQPWNVNVSVIAVARNLYRRGLLLVRGGRGRRAAAPHRPDHDAH